MNINNIYPWQHEVWMRLRASGRLPHALLLQGRVGTGKLNFAIELTKSLLCQAPLSQHQACNACSSCHWFEQNSHPDYRLLTPEQESAEPEGDVPTKKTTKKTQISVAQVRELGNFLELTSHRNDGLRIALIHPAETLNLASANALLKMLEEPPSGMMFILVSDQPQRLLPTILSRCQKIDMPVPDSATALAWLTQQGVKQAAPLLAYAGGSPLTALNQAEQGGVADILKELARGHASDCFIATSLLLAHGMFNALSILQKWSYDLLACKLASEVRYHVDNINALQSLVKSVDLGLLLDYQRKLDDAKKSAMHPLNHELQLEQILLQYRQIFKEKF